MKYCLQEYDDNLFAGSKAKCDTTSILRKMGYRPLYLSNSWMKSGKLPLANSIGGFCIQKKLRCLISLGCEIVIQWPFYEYGEVDYIINLIKKKNVRSVLLIHDLNNLRNFADSYLIDMKMCKVVTKIIAHSGAMKDYLVSNGIDGEKIEVLTSFDYLTDEQTPVRYFSNKVVFAGNLAKSQFLKFWDMMEHKCKMVCYGSKLDGDFSTIEYKGRFCPENINAIEGSWGLVWDGNSTDECNGDYGNYLRYNSPHKLSLYIVAGLPLIVWAHSALASYVLEKQLGIVVKSLNDIDGAINQMTNEVYIRYRDNVIEEAKNLKSGNHLKSVL